MAPVPRSRQRGRDVKSRSVGTAPPARINPSEVDHLARRAGAPGLPAPVAGFVLAQLDPLYLEFIFAVAEFFFPVPPAGRATCPEDLDDSISRMAAIRQYPNVVGSTAMLERLGDRAWTAVGLRDRRSRGSRSRADASRDAAIRHDPHDGDE